MQSAKRKTKATWTPGVLIRTRDFFGKNICITRADTGCPSRGFSLVELMVTISIFIIVTSITLTNYPKFSNKLSLDLLAQDVALSIRQAQIFGSSVFGAKSTGGTTRVFKAYGIHFNAPTVGQIIYPYFLFADIDNSLEFSAPLPLDQDLTCGDPTSTNECVQKFLVTGRNKVKLLCQNFIDSGIPAEQRVSNCENVNNNNQLSSLDIVFIRPNLDAKFKARNLIGDPVVDNFSNVGIILESLGGDYNKTVVVWKTGQISVE